MNGLKDRNLTLLENIFSKPNNLNIQTLKKSVEGTGAHKTSLYVCYYELWLSI